MGGFEVLVFGLSVSPTACVVVCLSLVSFLFLSPLSFLGGFRYMCVLHDFAL